MQPVEAEGNGDEDTEERQPPGGDRGEDEGGEAEEAGEPIRCLPCPGNPSAAERSLHEITHWPYRPWCEWCVRGRAVGPNSRKVPDDKKVNVVPKAHLDYAYLQDEVIEDSDEFAETGTVGQSMTIMVMLETLCGSVWAYATSGKGYAADPWLTKRIHSDLMTVGMGLIRIIIKTDTEPAI